MRGVLQFMLLTFPLLVTTAGAVTARNEKTESASAHLIRYAEDTPVGADSALILELSRTAAHADTATARYLHPLISALLAEGADALAEDINGCNAMFYLHGMPDFCKDLQQKNLLPRELALRLPKEEGQMLRYMKLRTAQAALAPNSESREYLVRRYCSPLYSRAEARMQRYLGAGSLYRVPESGMETCLAFMRLTHPQKAYAFVNQLPLWQHGEHFIEEIPAALLATLQQLNWQVNPGNLRQALQKLNSMLPQTEDDMIDCYASVPMASLLELLVTQEEERALPDLQKYEKSFDPELVQASLRLQLRLKGITPPDETDTPLHDAEAEAMREVLHADTAVHNGTVEQLDSGSLIRVADYLEREGLPEHAEIFRSMVEEEELIVTESSMPAVRAQYEDVKEERPRVHLLRKLLQKEPTPQS